MTGERPPSIRTVAEAVGLAPTTVSKALRGVGRMRRDTRERILAAAEQLGYRRDPALAALAAYRSGGRPRQQRIGLFRSRSFARSSRYGCLLEACHQRCEALGYAVEAVDIEQHLSNRQLDPVEWCDQRGIAAGILATQSWETDWHIHVGTRRPLVLIGNAKSDAPVTRVCTDDFGDMRTAFDTLWQSGNRRIGLVLSQRTDSNSDGRWSAAFRACQAAHGVLDQALLCDDRHTLTVLPQWLQASRPDAVIVVKRDAWYWLQQLPPAQRPNLARIGWHQETPKHQGIVHDLARLGQLAVDQLDIALRHALPGPTAELRMTIGGRWVSGEAQPSGATSTT